MAGRLEVRAGRMVWQAGSGSEQAEKVGTGRTRKTGVRKKMLVGLTRQDELATDKQKPPV
jgi:hypothetical protein